MSLTALCLIVAAIVGVLADWLLKPILPERPRGKHVVAIVLALLTLVALYAYVEVPQQEVGGLPLATIDGQILYYESQGWLLDDLGRRSSRRVNLPRDGVSSVTWSNDGHQILFGWRRDGTAKDALYLFDLDTGSVSPFLSIDGLDLGDPDWSPDGQFVVLTASKERTEANPQSDLYRYDVSSKHLQQLTSPRQWADYPTWSPDSKRIAFQAVESPGAPSRIFAMDGDGTRQEMISENAPGVHAQPQWSPRGDLIAFVAKHEEREEIWTVSATSKRVEQLTYSPSGTASTTPAWSPNGEWVVFHSNRDGKNSDGFGDVYITSLDRRLTYRVTSSHSTWFLLLSWRPRG
jgi:Tol biopolymer transport system component